MNSIDEDAKAIGINEETWKQFRELHRIEQPEFEEIVAPIDAKESERRHLDNMRRRWFEYYKKCQDKKKKMSLVDQYNKVALMKGHER